jgi:hypothetical protein
MESVNVADEVMALCRRAMADAPNEQIGQRVTAVMARLGGPLRIAIAGRVKAGKSTLLNAMVGERLAPTDAGECTKIVTWYRRGQAYAVHAKLHSGADQPLQFSRDGGALDVQLGGVSEQSVRWIDVQWPSSALERVTLIDTPGLASLNDENSRRTREFLDVDGDRQSDADAVIYLMRHVHAADISFLDAFMDRSVTAASPVNAVAVLSRADEIGAGRIDAMQSSARIAQRYAVDPQVRSLCHTVVPLAGLLAETGLTLREDEVAALRMLVATPAEMLDRMLMSAEQFCDVSSSELTVEIRRQLLGRLGMFGLRLAVDGIRSGKATTAAALGPMLVEASGLAQLREVIAQHFMPRGRMLQARSALVAMRALAREHHTVVPTFCDALERDVERVEAGAVDFARLRGAHLVASGTVRVNDAERAQLERLFLGTSPAASLGLQAGSSMADVERAALGGVSQWRTRGSDPLADPALVEVCETAARACEAIFARLRTPSS